MHFCVVLQKLIQRHFREKLVTKSFPWKEVKGNLEILKFHTEAITTVSRLFRDYLTHEKRMFLIL